MKSKKVFKTLVLIALISSIPYKVFAQDYNYKYGYDWWLSNFTWYYPADDVNVYHSWADTPKIPKNFPRNYASALNESAKLTNNRGQWLTLKEQNMVGYYVYSTGWIKDINEATYNSWFSGNGIPYSNIGSSHPKKSAHPSGGWNDYQKKWDSHYLGGDDTGPWADSVLNSMKGYYYLAYRQPKPHKNYAKPINAKVIKGNDYWYKKGEEIGIETSYHDIEGGARRRWARLYNSSGTRLLSLGVNDNGSGFTDQIDGNNFSNGRVQTINYDNANMIDRWYVKANAEADYKIGSLAWNGVAFSVGDTESDREGYNIRVDGTAPSIIGASNIEWTNSNKTVSISATDNGSGMEKIELYDSSNNKVAGGSSSLSYLVSNEGTNTYTVKAYDKVGNMSQSSFVVKIDKTPPTVSQLNVNVNNDNYTVFVQAKNVVDSLSGVNPNKVYVTISSKEDTSKFITSYLAKVGSTNDYSATINLQQGGINNIYGEMEVKLYVEDMVTNGRNKVSATGSFLKGRADLTIQTIQIVDSSNNPITNIVQNKDYRTKIVVANIDMLKSKSCNLQLRNVTNNTIVGNVTVAEINPGATTTVYIPINSSSLGSYEVEGFIDSNNIVVESNENNNKAKVSYSIYPQNNKPIAQFDVNPKIEDRNRPLTYSDTSYDPDSWDSIVQREWQWTRIKDEKGNTVSESINTGSTPPNSFNVYGTYQIKLRVKDKGNIASPSLWSDWSTPKNVQIKNLISVSAEIIPGEARQGQLVKLKIKTTYSPNKLFIKFPNDIIEKSNTKIKIDLNGDGIIDEADVDLLEPHYNAKPGDSNWKDEYDLNKDGIIDIFDMTIVAQNKGKEISEFDKLNEIVTLDIVPQDQSLTTEYEFYLPTNTDLTIDKNGKRVKNKYRFEIRALREIDGQEANTFVELDVKGSIYDGIRTRMK